MGLISIFWVFGKTKNPINTCFTGSLLKFDSN